MAKAFWPASIVSPNNNGLGIDSGPVLIFLVALWLSVQALLKVPLDWLAVISPVTAPYYSTAFSILNAEKIPDAVTISLERGVTLKSAH